MALWQWTKPKDAPHSVHYSFVIDTDSYAGNLERELGAYCVGQVDEYGEHRGGLYQALFEEALEQDPSLAVLKELSEFRMNDPGDGGSFMAPVEIAPTPGTKREFNSVAIFLSRKPTDSELVMLCRRAKAFETVPLEYRTPPKILGCRLVAERVELDVQDVGLFRIEHTPDSTISAWPVYVPRPPDGAIWFMTREEAERVFTAYMERFIPPEQREKWQQQTKIIEVP